METPPVLATRRRPLLRHQIVKDSAHRTDNPAVFRFGEGFQRFRGDVTLGANGKSELGTGFVVRKFGDQHSVTAPHRQVPGMDLPLDGFGSLPGSVKASRTVLDFRDPLLRVTEQHYVVWHRYPPMWNRDIMSFRMESWAWGECLAGSQGDRLLFTLVTCLLPHERNPHPVLAAKMAA